MDMVNDGVEDLRCKYVTLIYTNYVSPDPRGQLGAGLDEQRSFVHFCLPSFLCQSPSQAGAVSRVPIDSFWRGGAGRCP